MKISSIQITDFRRFKELRVESIPASTKLVVMAGPNGSGKSSLFDALLTCQRAHGGISMANDPLYYLRGASLQTHFHAPDKVNVVFHEGPPSSQGAWRRSLYVRSAYRNDPDFTLNSISSSGRAIDQSRVHRMADNDATVSQNYASITSKAMHDLFKLDETSTVSAVSFKNSFIGDINVALTMVFDDLVLTSLGVPGEAGAFFFSKGDIKDFHYKNLSGGEKAAFDLLIDFIAKRATFNNTVYCIDEPEVHLNTKTQGRLIRALYKLLPDNCQLWIATHAIGMIREARDIFNQCPGDVAFVDFGGRDFDLAQVIEPIAPTQAFWRDALEVALDDLSALVAPAQIVICEGLPSAPGKAASNADHDARCYNRIFAATRSDTLFVSGGNSHEVSTDRHVLVSGLRSVVEGATIKRLIDRDDHSEDEVIELKARGIRVLRFRHLECYLWSEEILTLLCAREHKNHVVPDLLQARLDALARLPGQGKAQDDVKSASGQIYSSVKSLLGMSQTGSNAREFMRKHLAPLVVPGTDAYSQLDEDIFSVSS